MKVPASGRITRHFRRLAKLSAVRFVLRVSLESLVLRLLVALLLLPFRYQEGEVGRGITFLDAVVVAPVIETLVFQALPVRYAQFFTQRFKILLLVAWLPFGALHFFNGFESGVAGGLVGGYYIGFSYAVWVRRSHGQAIVVTTAIHALGNGAAWLLFQLG